MPRQICNSMAVFAVTVCSVFTKENTWLLAILGFVAFRIIDIFKPLGCRWVDQNVKGGWGVMLDDALAGFYSLIICLIVKQFL